VERAEKTVLLISRAKFGVTGLMTFAQLEDFDVLITDAPPSPEEQARVNGSGAQLIIAQDQ